MPETKHFNPLDWFLTACFTVLAGAVALVAAIHLLQAIWVGLAIGAGTVVLLGTAIHIAIWLYRRQSW